MTRENVQAVADIFEGWRRGDFGVGEDVWHPQIEFVVDDTVSVSPGTFHGVAEMSDSWREQLSAWEWFDAVVEEIVEAKDQIVVFNRIRGRGRGSGIDVDARRAAVFTFRDGKVVSLRLTTREEALELTGRGE
ncbi:MAG: nuclear transport factor 2 family protein [Thermoleophilaceae bacterium]